MFELFEQLLLHLQQEVVVVLHLLGGVHHEGAHQVRAVRLVADAHGAGDGTKVHVVLIAGEEKFKRMKVYVPCDAELLWPCRCCVGLPDYAELEAVVASALDDRRVTHLHRGRVGTTQILLLLDGLLHRFRQFTVTDFLFDGKRR